MEGRAWYVIHTYSGYENKVRTNLEHRIESMDARDLIFQVIVPTEEEIEIKDGQRRTVEKKVFPGYVLVQMIELREDDPQASRAWFVVRNTPGVTGFVGSGLEPTSLDVAEVQEDPAPDAVGGTPQSRSASLSVRACASSTALSWTLSVRSTRSTWRRAGSGCSSPSSAERHRWNSTSFR